MAARGSASRRRERRMRSWWRHDQAAVSMVLATAYHHSFRRFGVPWVHHVEMSEASDGSPVIEYVAPARAVTHDKPTLVAEYVTPAPDVTYATPATVIEYASPALTVTNTTPAHVIEYVAPAPADTNATPAPVIQYVTPALVIEHIAPAPSSDPCYAQSAGGGCISKDSQNDLWSYGGIPRKHIATSGTSSTKRTRTSHCR